MSDFKKFLQNAGYFSLGVAAVALDAGGKAVKALVKRGKETLQDNQDTVDTLKRKAKEASEKIKGAVQDLAKKAATPVEESPEAASSEAEAPAIDFPETDIPEVAAPVVEMPVVPDVIYRTEEPAPVEEDEAAAEEDPKPEEPING